VRTLRRFPLDTNLTKWLSKCEGSLQKGKEKKPIKMVWMMQRQKLKSIKEARNEEDDRMEKDVEQNALMTPNPSGKLEDLATVCVV